MENIRISDLNLSKSARNILFKQNIKHVKALITLTNDDINNLETFSENMREEIFNYRNKLININNSNYSNLEELFGSNFLALLRAENIKNIKELNKIRSLD